MLSFSLQRALYLGFWLFSLSRSWMTLCNRRRSLIGSFLMCLNVLRDDQDKDELQTMKRSLVDVLQNEHEVVGTAKE
jgi:hypothetical protein